MAGSKKGKKAKKQAQPGAGTSGMRVFYIALAVVAVGGIGMLGYGVVGDRLGGAAVEPVELTGVDDPRVLMERASGVAAGSPDAPVTILEFGDYQCPACGTFAAQVKPFLDMEYIQQGRVRFVFYDFPLTTMHQHAFLAARSARCAGEQDAYWEYHDRLFGEQSRWSFEDRVVDDFVRYAEDIGLDGGSFEACVNSDRYADVVSAGRMLGQRLGVNSTPTLIVNGQRVRNPMDYGALKELIDGLFAGRTSASEGRVER